MCEQTGYGIHLSPRFRVERGKNSCSQVLVRHKFMIHTLVTSSVIKQIRKGLRTLQLAVHPDKSETRIWAMIFTSWKSEFAIHSENGLA